MTKPEAQIEENKETVEQETELEQADLEEANGGTAWVDSAVAFGKAIGAL